jgi:hypothetical protein
MKQKNYSDAEASKRKRFKVITSVSLLAMVVALLLWIATRHSTPEASSEAQAPAAVQSSSKKPITGGSVTHIYAHNLRLHQGPDFRIYIQWLRGELAASSKKKIPSFDDTDSFYLNITNGVIRANLGDIGNYLNKQMGSGGLTDIVFRGEGQEVKITGKLHKLISIPVQLSGTISPASNNRIHVHVAKIDVLKLPFKWLLKTVHVTLADVVGSGKISGVDIQGNDIFLDPEELLPPPHIRGTLTQVTIKSPDLEAVYGDATQDVERVEQWRNFLRMRDGTLNFGKLTMNNVDLIMIDISQDAWFDLDLANYQAQLVKGYTRMTPQAGLQIFMPDVSALKDVATKDISIEWLKDRNVAPPADVVPKKR